MERLTRRDWSKYGFYDKETPILGARREYELYQRLGRYEDIGTLEECRAAVEKQTAKKVKSISQVKDGDSYVRLIGRCPCCGDVLEEDTVYCDCGQRLDWETSDEID